MFGGMNESESSESDISIEFSKILDGTLAPLVGLTSPDPTQAGISQSGISRFYASDANQPGLEVFQSREHQMSLALQRSRLELSSANAMLATLTRKLNSKKFQLKELVGNHEHELAELESRLNSPHERQLAMQRAEYEASFHELNSQNVALVSRVEDQDLQLKSKAVIISGIQSQLHDAQSQLSVAVAKSTEQASMIASLETRLREFKIPVPHSAQRCQLLSSFRPLC